MAGSQKVDVFATEILSNQTAERSSITSDDRSTQIIYFSKNSNTPYSIKAGVCNF